jgi:hypothetical protein
MPDRQPDRLEKAKKTERVIVALIGDNFADSGLVYEKNPRGEEEKRKRRCYVLDRDS